MATLHEHQYTFSIISRSVHLRMKNVSDKRYRENQNTFFCPVTFFRKSCRLWDKVENNVERGRPQWQYGPYALHAGYLRLQIYTHRLWNTHCFSTEKLVAQTRHNVTLYVHCPSCFASFQTDNQGAKYIRSTILFFTLQNSQTHFPEEQATESEMYWIAKLFFLVILFSKYGVLEIRGRLKFEVTRYLMSQARFEPGSSQIWITSATAWTNFLESLSQHI
jgi:hypothetical protein